MIWFIIGLIITIVCTVIAFSEGGFKGCVGVFFMTGLMFFMLSLLLCAFIGVIMECWTTPKETVVNSIDLIALQDNSSAYGSFFLGCGTVEEEQYYYYIVQEKLGMKEEKVEADNAYIQYSKDAPHIDVINRTFSKEWYNWFAFPTWDNCYIFYIPEGSVTTQFNVDLKNN